jgi:hypothetical protein
MTSIVHGWCGFVEKSNDVVFQQMVINKLWIADDMINEIKDYLYISAAEVLRRFYRLNLNRSITDMWVNYRPLTDIYGRDRKAIYAIGHVYGDGNIQIQGTVCLTCGDFDHRHNNMNNCCALEFDLVDEPIHLVEDYWGPDEEINTETAVEAEVDVAEAIPEVTWEINVPTSQFIYTDPQQAQFVRDALQQAREDAERDRIESELWGRQPENYDYDFDIESEAADYKEYLREVEMEAYLNRR